MLSKQLCVVYSAFILGQPVTAMLTTHNCHSLSIDLLKKPLGPYCSSNV